MDLKLSSQVVFRGMPFGPGIVKDAVEGLREEAQAQGALDQVMERTGDTGSLEAEGLDGNTAQKLRDAGLDTPAKVTAASDEDLLAISGIGQATLERIRDTLSD